MSLPKLEYPLTEEKLITKLLRVTMHGNEATMIIWIPSEFFRMQIASSPIFGDRIESFMDIFRSYTFICATAAKIQFQRASDEEFYTEAEVRRNIHIKDSQGKLHKSLEETEISPYMLYMLREFRLRSKASLEKNTMRLDHMVETIWKFIRGDLSVKNFEEIKNTRFLSHDTY